MPTIIYYNSTISWVCFAAFLQSSIYATMQPMIHVYTWLTFIISVYARWNTKGLNFQFPLCLLCQLTELCHTFLSLILSSSILGIVMIYNPIALEFEFFSCIPLLYVQTCYMHNILHVSCSFYCNQLLCGQTYCKKYNILWSTWNVMISCDFLEPFYFCI